MVAAKGPGPDQPERGARVVEALEEGSGEDWSSTSEKKKKRNEKERESGDRC